MSRNAQIDLGRSDLIPVERIALKDYLIISRLRGKMCRIKAQIARHIVNMARDSQRRDGRLYP